MTETFGTLTDADNSGLDSQNPCIGRAGGHSSRRDLAAIFGHATIIAAEKWIAVVLAVLFGGLAAFVLPHASFAQISAINHGGGSFSTWLVAMGIIFSYPIGWANFASDYSRYFPAETSWKKIVLAAGGGQFVALMFCEVIGVLFATALGGTLGDNPVSQLGRFLPTWFIVPLLFSIILGGIAANVPNGYTAGLGLLALRIPINRITSLTVIALFTLCFRVVTVLYGQFFDMYQVFLNYMVFWTAPWAAFVVVDYFMRRGRYQTDAWMKWGYDSLRHFKNTNNRFGLASPKDNDATVKRNQSW